MACSLFTLKFVSLNDLLRQSLTHLLKKFNNLILLGSVADPGCFSRIRLKFFTQKTDTTFSKIRSGIRVAIYGTIFCTERKTLANDIYTHKICYLILSSAGDGKLLTFSQYSCRCL
jgi:hypothetical protein